MKFLTDILEYMEYLENKRFIKKFEKNPKNYANGTLMATTEYANAGADVAIYEMSRD